MVDRERELEMLDSLIQRVEVLQRLCEGPVHKRDLIEELDQSRSTVGRAIRELEEMNLAERRSEGFAATTSGRLAVESLAEFRGRLGDVVEAEPVLSPLGTDAPISTDVVAGGDAMVAAEPAPYQPIERFHDELESAARYRALLPALDDPRHVRLLYEHVVTRDRPAELVVTPALFETLCEEFPRRLAAMADHEGFRLFVAEELPPFALTLLEPESGPGPTVGVVVFADGSGVHGIVLNETAAAVRWAERRYGSARAGAAERTDALTDGAVGATAAARSSGLPHALERAGFVRLGVPYFRDEPVAEPTTAWRAGLSLAEVHTGYTVDRPHQLRGDGSTAIDRPADEDREGGSMTATLLSDLADGTDRLVVGSPGSGKSTVCKRVACEWYDAGHGPVFYREQGRGGPFEAVELLVAAAETAEGHPLVVVEDAVRPEANAVFDAIERLAGRGDVSFLLDARTNEWVDPPEGFDAGVDLPVATMPSLAERDARRLVEHFEATVGETVDVPVDQLWDDVREELGGDDVAPGGVLLLLHRLATYADPLSDEQTSLEEAAAALYDDVAGDDVALSVCVLANALNAAGLAVAPGALYAVADPAEFGAVDDARERLAGRLLFPRPDGYRTVHESWSVAFLARALDAEGERAADRFGDALTAFLSLADDPDRPDRIAAHLDGEWGRGVVGDDPDEWVGDAVEAIYAIGRDRPKLAPLFGDGADDSIDLPAATPAWVRRRRPVWLGRTFLSAGAYDRAQRAFERLSEDEPEQAVERLLGLARIATERGESDDAVARAERCMALVEEGDRQAAHARAAFELGRALHAGDEYADARERYRTALEAFEALDDRRRTARVLNRLGKLERVEGNYDDAAEHYRRSLDRFREIGDWAGEAEALQSLSMVMWDRGEYDDARRYVNRSLELRRANGDTRGECVSLNHLAGIVKNVGEFEQACEYYERCREIASDHGIRDIEGKALGNYALTAARLGEYEDARERIEATLDGMRELGKRRSEAIRLNNLGLIAVRQADHGVARDSFARGKAIAVEMELRPREVNSHNGLGHVARMQGAFTEAREHHETALALAREIDNRRAEADSLNKLGLVALAAGEYDRARERFREGLGLARELDHAHEEAISLGGLGAVARRQESYELATEYLETATELSESTGDRIVLSRVRLEAARLALDRGDRETARERGEAVREGFAEMGTRQWTARSCRHLGRVAAAAGEAETAREHLRSALETFEDVGAPQDALATLSLLLDVATDGESADQYRERAGGIAASAPDAAVAQHREWLEAELDREFQASPEDGAPGVPAEEHD